MGWALGWNTKKIYKWKSFNVSPTCPLINKKILKKSNTYFNVLDVCPRTDTTPTLCHFQRVNASQPTSILFFWDKANIRFIHGSINDPLLAKFPNAFMKSSLFLPNYLDKTSWSPEISSNLGLSRKVRRQSTEHRDSKHNFSSSSSKGKKLSVSNWLYFKGWWENLSIMSS